MERSSVPASRQVTPWGKLSAEGYKQHRIRVCSALENPEGNNINHLRDKTYEVKKPMKLKAMIAKF